MNFGQAFTYVFEDPDWAKKVLIPALIGIIPILGQIFLLGWSLDVTRRLIQKNPRPQAEPQPQGWEGPNQQAFRQTSGVLPELDFGRQFMDGLKAVVIGLVYAIPIIIVQVPISIVSAGLANNSSPDQNTVATVFGIVSLCCGGLIFIYSLLLAFYMPAAYANFIANEKLSAGFRFSEIIALLRAAPGAYLLVLLGLIVSGFIGGLGAIACFIGVFATLAYSMAVNGHLYGQAYNEATRNRGFAKVY